jgi:hypothetical protein
VLVKANWCANESARLAHVLSDTNCQQSLILLTRGPERDQLDAGQSKKDAFDNFALFFNDSSVRYQHPCPGNMELSLFDPNPPISVPRTGEKLKDVFRAIKAKMTSITAMYEKSGNGGEIPFYNFCNGEAIYLYWHKVQVLTFTIDYLYDAQVWEHNPFYNALVRLTPGGMEEGAYCIDDTEDTNSIASPPPRSIEQEQSDTAASLGKRKPLPQFTPGCGKKRASMGYGDDVVFPSTISFNASEEEKSLVQKKCQLADIQILNDQISALQSKLTIFDVDSPMSKRISAKIEELVNKLIAF